TGTAGGRSRSSLPPTAACLLPNPSPVPRSRPTPSPLLEPVARWRGRTVIAACSHARNDCVMCRELDPPTSHSQPPHWRAILMRGSGSDQHCPPAALIGGFGRPVGTSRRRPCLQVVDGRQ